MAWEGKRLWLKHSLPRLTHGTLLSPPPNSDISDWATIWDERRIHARGAYLASLSLDVWTYAEDLLASPIPADHNDK